MKEACVVNLSYLLDDTSVASHRICKFVSKTLGDLPVVDRKEKCDYYETVIQINGATGFCKFREEYADMVRNCRRFIFIQNDYSLAPPSQIGHILKAYGFTPNGRLVTVPNRWTTVPFKMRNKHDHYINWNCLAYNPPENLVLDNERLDGIFYYGAFRPSREESFERYFRDAAYPIFLSSSTRAFHKYNAINEDIQYLEYFNHLVDEASVFKATLYIEDKFSHKHFTSPATRFYECISAGIGILVDAKAVNTLREGNIFVDDDWIVKDKDDVFEKLLRIDEIRYAQQAVWHKDYVGEIKGQLLDAYNGYIQPMLKPEWDELLW